MQKLSVLSLTSMVSEETDPRRDFHFQAVETQELPGRSQNAQHNLLFLGEELSSDTAYVRNHKAAVTAQNLTRFSPGLLRRRC